MSVNKTLNQCSIVLTRDCNLRCNFCYVKDAGYCSSEMVSFENLKQIVDFCCDANVKFIFFTGGEPLLYPYLNDILRYIKEKSDSIKTAVATNGVLLEDLQFCEEIIKNGLDYVDVSMKGNNSQEWISTTGYDGYTKQQKAIKNLSNLNFDFTCSMVVTLDNVNNLCDSVKNALNNGAKQFSFTFMIDNDKSLISEAGYIENNNPFKLVENFINQVDKLNKLTDDWWIEYSFPLCVFTDEQLTILDGRLASPCQIHKKNSVTFDTQLNLLPCDMYFDRKIGRLGKDFYNAEEFYNLTTLDPYKETIDKIGSIPSNKCVDCQYFDKCYGGCPVLWNNYSFDELLYYKEKYYN